MAAYTYSYGKMSNLFKNPAEVAGPVCLKLKESKIGLSPETLLEASRAEDAPLHNEFEWDDTVAAEKFRKEQARFIIRNLEIHRVDAPTVEYPKERAFLYTGEKKTGYVPMKDILTNDEWRTNLLNAAKRDMNYFIAKYHRLEELTKIINDMREILSEDEAS